MASAFHDFYKKPIRNGLATILLFFGTALNHFATAQQSQVTELRIASPTGFIASELIKQFSNEFNVEVKQVAIYSNKVIHEKLKFTKGTDVDLLLVPSQLIDQLRQEGLLQFCRTDELSVADIIHPHLLQHDFDPENQYSIPFVWGKVQIGVAGPLPDSLTVKVWSDIWQPGLQDKIILMGDADSVLRIALTASGYDINTTNPDDIHQAYIKLRKLMPNIKGIQPNLMAAPVGATSSEQTEMPGKENTQQDSPSLHFISPAEAPTFWLQSFAIPVGSRYPELAHQFIEFALTAQNASLNSQITHLESANFMANTIKGTKDQADKSLSSHKTDELQPKHAEAKFPTDSGNAKALYQFYWKHLIADEQLPTVKISQ